MSQLTDTQREVLLAAAQHQDKEVILPERLKGGAVQVVVEALLARGLIEQGSESLPIRLRITEAGVQAVKSISSGVEGAEPTPLSSPSKQSIVVELLRRPQGASLDEITAATSWQKHSVRGLISGSLKKKLGLAVVSEKVEGVRRYRIGSGQ